MKKTFQLRKFPNRVPTLLNLVDSKVVSHFYKPTYGLGIVYIGSIGILVYLATAKKVFIQHTHSKIVYYALQRKTTCCKLPHV